MLLLRVLGYKLLLVLLLLVLPMPVYTRLCDEDGASCMESSGPVEYDWCSASSVVAKMLTADHQA